MARIRYIGSKARIAPAILELVGDPGKDAGRFVDLFSGTGIVSRTAALRGWRIVANDYLHSSALVTEAGLISVGEVPFRRFGGYAAAVDALNSAKSVKGFIYDEYSPSGRSRSGEERRYFTMENGARIDGIRECISNWKQTGLTTKTESKLLTADLLLAANQVANTAGTYGCFLREWTSSALPPLQIRPRQLLPLKVSYRVMDTDAFSFRGQPDDVVYLDPPYTKRQYAAYYHILETIAVGDYPHVSGKTGLRSWSEKSSPFCFKRKAMAALMQLVQNVGGRRLILSYSSEGHLDIAEIERSLQRVGTVSTLRLEKLGRYRPNEVASGKADCVTEFLIDVMRDETAVQKTKDISSLAA